MGLDQVVLLQDQRALDGVVQLAHVARPGMPAQAVGRLRREPDRRQAHLAGVLDQQALGQRQDVRRTLAQRAPGQREHRETVIEVFAEAPGRHLALQVAVGGGQHADVQRQRLARADPLHLALLQHAQQLGLQAQGHFGDFVEQDGAAVGQLELAGLRGDGAGEGALLVAEQGGFQHVVRDRRAVDGHEGLAGARRALVNVARQHFLAGAGLAGDQHGGIAARHPGGQFQQLAAGRLLGHRAVILVQGQHAVGVARHQIEQRLGLERLEQVVGGALAHGVHRALDGAEGGHQQHRQLRLLLADGDQQLVAVHARHVHVADHQRVAVLFQGQQRLFGILHGAEGVAAQLQGVAQRIAQRAVVFDQQNLGCHAYS